MPATAPPLQQPPEPSLSASVVIAETASPTLSVVATTLVVVFEAILRKNVGLRGHIQKMSSPSNRQPEMIGERVDAGKMREIETWEEGTMSYWLVERESYFWKGKEGKGNGK